MPETPCVKTIVVGDVEVRRLGFGAMRLCGPDVVGWPADRSTAPAVLRRALELGVNFIDTADAYGPEVNELQIAEALHPYPEGLLIGTKGGYVRSGAAWIADGRPEHIRAACEASLRRLRLDAIDLYQFHRPDPKVPLAESMGAFRELRDAGKIRYVGVSNVSADQLEVARSIVPVVSVQNEYNLANRFSEDVLEVCGRGGIAFIPWYPLDVGRLARPDGAVGRVAARHGATPAQVSLAWLLQHSPVIVPIPGTASVAHLEENVAAAELRLSDRDTAELAA